MGCGDGSIPTDEDGTNEDGTNETSSIRREESWPPPRTPWRVPLEQISQNASQFHSIIRPPVQSIELSFIREGLLIGIRDSATQSNGMVVASFVNTNECSRFNRGNQEVALAVLVGFSESVYYILFKNTGDVSWKNLGILTKVPPTINPPLSCRPYNLNSLDHDVF